jgi:uncharacterized protein
MILCTKNCPLDASDLKFDDAREGTFSGYASVFGGVDSYGDMILPGAYSETLKNRQRPVLMRWNHGQHVIGKWNRLEEDGKGLFVEGELTPGHSVASDALALLKHKAVDGLSIGYRIAPGGSEKDGKIRRLKKIDLIEVSIVDVPADTAARVADVKAAIEEAASLKDVEELLRESANFSRADVTALVSRIKALVQSDSGPNEAAVIADLIRRVKVA